LKKLGKRYYSDDFLYRKKMGFAVPAKDWLLGGSANTQVREKILDQGNKLDDLFNRETLSTILKSNNAGNVWLLLFLQEWMHQNK
jgi:asparagine synthase (glutamine-hydrolysing)